MWIDKRHKLIVELTDNDMEYNSLIANSLAIRYNLKIVRTTHNFDSKLNEWTKITIELRGEINDLLNFKKDIDYRLALEKLLIGDN